MPRNRRASKPTGRRTDEALTIPTGASPFMADVLLAAHEELAQLED